MTATAQRRSSRLALTVVTGFALALPLIGYGALAAMRTTSNDPRQWLPRGFAETDTYDWFDEQFGTDEVAVVSWPGATLQDPRVARLAAALEHSVYFDRARTGQETLQQLTGGPSGMSRVAALRRLVGTLVGPDGKSTLILLTTSAAGQADRPAAIAEIQRLADSVAGIPASQLKLAGPTVDAAAIDAESRRLLFGLAGLSAIASLAIAVLRMRSLPMAVIVLSIAVLSTALTLAAMYFSGGKMNLLMTMLPPLVYVLSISAAVHLANYYHDAVAERELRTGTPHLPADAESGAKAPLRVALAHGWLPCTMAALTTAIGLASLASSSIDPIREFGIYAAGGVIISLATLFVLFPALLTLYPVRRRQPRVPDGPPRSRWPVRLVSRYPLTVMGCCLAVMLVCGWRLPQLESTVRLQDRFLDSSDVIRDYRWLEQQIGPMVPLELALHFGANDPRSPVEQLQVVAAVQAAIRDLAEPTATISAVNLSPPLPLGRRTRDAAARQVLNSPQTQQRLIEAGFLSVTERATLWRISVRAPAIGDLDYGLFAEQLRTAIDPVLAAAGVQGTYTGIIPLIYKAQRQLLMDLFRSFLAAFVVIAVVLAVLLRSLLAALLAMIPNLFPAVVVFGGIDWIGIPVQIGSVMTASAALGIAVDDTVHFLTWYRRGIGEGTSRAAAVSQAFGRCAGAMVHTTLICAGGLLVFALSSFVPILHFAYLMVLLLLAALVGDLVLLPAILVGPLGRFVDRS